MEKIAQHIETLLRRHDYVIVPDFGGFVTQQQSAKIGYEQISAPLAVVGFNPLMNVSDGLLAIEISRAENKSFREAMQLIESETILFKQLLKNRNYVSCGNLGALSTNSDNKITFIPSENSKFLPANYGLNTLYYSKIATQIANNEKKTVTISIPSRSKVARYAAVAIIAGGLMFSAPKLNDARNTTAGLNPISFMNTSDKAIESNNTTNTATFTNAEKATTVNSNTASQIEVKKFYIIVGCLATQKVADELCNNLKKNNYPNAMVLPPIKTYRVAITSFTTQKEAVSYMENLRKTNPSFPDAWVLNY